MVDNSPHVIVQALAGSGKTTTLIEALNLLKGNFVKITPSQQQKRIWDEIYKSNGKVNSIGFVAFNKSIASELQQRVPLGCDAMTMHSMGLRAVTNAFGRPTISAYRIGDIISEITGRDIYELRRFKMPMLKAVEGLVSLCKQNLTDGSIEGGPSWDEELNQLASYYDIELNGSRNEVFELVPKVLERCKDVLKDRTIDYDDMVWLPVALGLSVQKYDLLLVDEAQDLNRCQQQLALMVGRRLVLCGDKNQAIYMFAGADAESLDRMGKILGEHERGVVELPLTVTRRCGRAIVEEAKKIVPSFETHESNGEGKISYARYASSDDKKAVSSPKRVLPSVGNQPIESLPVSNEGQNRLDGNTGKDDADSPVDDSYVSLVRDGDFIICRVNAPLVSQCFRFIKAGRKAVIQGRDIGQGLIRTVNKMKAVDVVDLISKLSEWLHGEQQKENAKRNPNENRLIVLQDRYDCLLCFCDGVQTVEQVLEKIKAMFTDDKSGTGIRLSSIHKAKGLEFKRVFFLMPKGARCPHPMAKSTPQKVQERNLLYVGITRAIEELIYVT